MAGKLDPARDSVDEFIKLLIHPPHQFFQSPHTLSHTHSQKSTLAHTHKQKNTTHEHYTRTHTFFHTHSHNTSHFTPHSTPPHTPATYIYDKFSRIKTTKSTHSTGLGPSLCDPCPGVSIETSVMAISVELRAITYFLRERFY